MNKHDCEGVMRRLDEGAKAFVLSNLTDPDLDVTLALLAIGDCSSCLPRYEAALQLLASDPDVAPLLGPGSEPSRILVESLLRIAEAGYSGPHAEELAAIRAIEDRLALAKANDTGERRHAAAQRAAQTRAPAGAPSLLVLAAGALRERVLDSVRHLGRFALARLAPDRAFLAALVDRLEGRWEVRPATLGAPEEEDDLPKATKHERLASGEIATSPCRFEILEPIELVRADSESECRIVGRIAPRDELTPAKDWLFALYTDEEVHGFLGALIPMELRPGASSALEFTPDPEHRLPLRLHRPRVPLLRADWRRIWKAVFLDQHERRHRKRG